jgi:hypothetical protein
MTHPAYPAAREAAARIYAHFARYHYASATAPAILPEPEIIEAMIGAAFWASLRREELYTPRISLAFVAREHLDEAFILQRPVPLSPQPLTRLGPAVERPGIHLAVWPAADSLQVWGTTRMLPAGSFVLQVLAPGLLVIKQSREEETDKFINLAVLQGEEVKIVNHHATGSCDCPELITSLLGLDSHFTSSGPANILIQLALSMRAHSRGGALLVVPSSKPRLWQESMLQPIMYAADPAFSVLADFIKTDRTSRPALAREQLNRLVEGVAGLTAVDGATIINDHYEVLAFGAKIIRRPGCGQVNEVRVTEPTEGFIPLKADPSQLGGTRHLSAAQFAHDQKDSIALVASQDGRFTVFAWSHYEEIVHAHRIETLLL